MGTRRRLAGQLAGEHRSPRHGSSLDFADYRDVPPGRRLPAHRLPPLRPARHAAAQALRGRGRGPPAPADRHVGVDGPRREAAPGGPGRRRPRVRGAGAARPRHASTPSRFEGAAPRFVGRDAAPLLFRHLAGPAGPGHHAAGGRRRPPPGPARPARAHRRVLRPADPGVGDGPVPPARPGRRRRRRPRARPRGPPARPRRRPRTGRRRRRRAVSPSAARPTRSPAYAKAAEAWADEVAARARAAGAAYVRVGSDDDLEPLLLGGWRRPASSDDRPRPHPRCQDVSPAQRTGSEPPRPSALRNPHLVGGRDAGAAMSFTAPAGLALLALAIPIVLLHILRPRRPEVVVGSTYLWQPLAGARFRRLARGRSCGRRCCCSSSSWPCCCSPLAVARPVRLTAAPSGPAHRVHRRRLRVDGRQRRRARPHRRRPGNRAQAAAKAAPGRRAGQRRRRLGPAPGAAVGQQRLAGLHRGAGRHPPAGGHGRLRRRLQPGREPGDARRPHRLRASSPTAGSPPPSRQLLPPGTRYEKVGDRATNRAITRLVVEPRGSGLHALVTLRNTGGPDATQTLRLDVDGRTAAHRSGPPARRAASWNGRSTFPPASGSRPSWRATTSSPPTTTPTPPPPPAPASASSWPAPRTCSWNGFWPPFPASPSSAARRPGPPRAPTSPSTTASPSPPTRAPPGWPSPRPAAPPASPSPATSTQPAVALVRVRASAPGRPRPLRGRHGHGPAPQARRPTTRSSSAPRRPPLLVRGSRGGRAFAYLGFTLADSNLPLAVAFPVLADRLLTDLSGAAAAARRPPGRPAAARPPSGAAVTVLRPGGHQGRGPGRRRPPRWPTAPASTASVRRAGPKQPVAVNAAAGESAPRTRRPHARPAPARPPPASGPPGARSRCCAGSSSPWPSCSPPSSSSAAGPGACPRRQWRAGLAARARHRRLPPRRPRSASPCPRAADGWPPSSSSTRPTPWAPAAGRRPSSGSATPSTTSPGAPGPASSSSAATPGSRPAVGRPGPPRPRRPSRSTPPAPTWPAPSDWPAPSCPTTPAGGSSSCPTAGPPKATPPLEARRLKEDGIDLDVHAVAGATGPDAAIARLDSPGTARKGESFTAPGHASPPPGPGRPASRCSAGRHARRGTDRRPRGRRHRRRVHPDGRRPRPVPLPARGRRRRRLVPPTTPATPPSPSKGRPRSWSPKAPPATAPPWPPHSGPAASTSSVKSAPPTCPPSTGSRTYSATVLVDVDAHSLSGRADRRDLSAATRDLGRGLVVLGGDRSYALGGYRDSELEQLLPVVSDITDPKRQAVGGRGAGHRLVGLDGRLPLRRRQQRHRPTGGNFLDGGVNKTDIARAGAARAVEALSAPRPGRHPRLQHRAELRRPPAARSRPRRWSTRACGG